MSTRTISITNEDKPPRRLWDCTGASFCLTDLWEPIIRGIQDDILLLFLEVVFVDVIADDRGNYTHYERNEHTLHMYHLLPPWINAVSCESGSIGAIIAEKFSAIKKTPDVASKVFY